MVKSMCILSLGGEISDGGQHPSSKSITITSDTESKIMQQVSR